jgi:hypothetical protein
MIDLDSLESAALVEEDSYCLREDDLIVLIPYTSSLES